MRILFYAKSPDATEYYRVSVPAKYLRRLPGVEVITSFAEKHPKLPESGVRFTEIEWADVIVFQRPATEPVLKIMEMIKTRYPKKILLLDYDDDYYAVPKWNPGYPFIKINERYWPQFPALVDGIITSTEPLADVFRGKAKTPVAAIPNGFDFEMFDEVVPEPDMVIQNLGIDKASGKAFVNYQLNLAEFRAVMENKTLITWAGSRFHFVDLDWIAADVQKLIKERKDVNFMFVSYMQANLINGVPPNRIFTTNGLSPVQRFYGLLKSIDSDIMLAPLDPCAFNRSKSNLKTMEIMSLKAFPICSAWDPYEDDLDPELNDDANFGLLAGYEKGDWYRAMNQALEMISDKSFKSNSQIVNDGYVRATHDAASRSQLYLEFISSLEKT